ncbi:MAG: hypothetical protein ACXABI_03025 [Candidatus Hodarchaeales archaeon]|jgi:hypothetical protein
MAVEYLNLFGLVILLMEITVSIILLYSLWNRWHEIKIPVIAILFGLYVLFIGFVGFETISYTLNFNRITDFYLEEGNWIASLFPFYGGISSGIFLLFIEFFRKDRVSPIHSSIYGVFIGAIVFNLIFKFLFPEFSITSETTIIEGVFDVSDVVRFIFIILFTTNFPTAYFIVYVIVVSFRSLQATIQEIQDKRRKIQIRMLQLSMVFFYVIPLILAVIARFVEMSPGTIVFLRHFAPHMSVLIGSFLIYIAYVKAPLGLLQFHKLEKLMVINKSGLLLYSYDFNQIQEDKPDRDVLYSGGVLAVLNLFTEMMETTNMEMIEFQEQIILLSNNENFITFLIADHESRFLWSAVKGFSKFFNLKYGTDAQELTVVPRHVFEDASSLVKLAFGH